MKFNLSISNHLYMTLLNVIDQTTLFEIISHQPFDILHIKNPSKKLQLLAVKTNGMTIQFIKNPCEKVQLEAVKQNGYVIKYIERPSEKIKINSVKQNGYAIIFINDPSYLVQFESIHEINENHELSDDYIKKITNSKLLLKLYNKTKNKKTRENILKSKYWKDAANLILEVINER